MFWQAVFRFIAALLSGASKSTAPKTPPSRPAPQPRIEPTPRARPYLDTLIVQDGTPLRVADYIAAAERLACEWQALAAVAEVESGREGAFGPDGRPIILYERHLFAAKTGGLYNLSHPHLSQPRGGGYPPDQQRRWRQLSEAYALHPAAAIESASWGRFQLLGQNYATMDLPDAHAYVARLARSEVDQLHAFEAFIRHAHRDLLPALRARDWATFARRYNGANYAQNRYDQRMAEAYQRIKNRAPASV